MITQLYHAQLQRVLDLFFKAKKASLMLEGTFGIGKTYAMREFAKRKAKELGLAFSEDFADVNDETKFSFLVFVLHHYEPGEFKGIPYPDKDRQFTIYLPMKQLPINPAKKAVLFIDEINSASDMLRKNAYQLIEDRRIGSYRVPDGVLVCGAGNKSTDKCNVYDMEMALCNRFLWAELNVPPVEDIDIEENGKKVTINGWLTDFAIKNNIDHRVQNYLRSNKNHLYTYDPNQDEPDKTQGTPRIWAKVSDLLVGVPDDDFWTLETAVGMGCGTGIGATFTAWIKLKAKYDIPKIYKELKLVVPTEVSLRYSLISGLIGHYLENKTQDRAVALTKLSLQFSREHTLMILNQVKYADTNFFKNLKVGDPKLYSSLADDVFKYLL